ncbi:MAG: DNA cytosine methyltransferase [Calothrix sp. MO_167.B42]|nr:DNA cytosine methyltransferase [Calothrix sp. MO_167.B42]
MKCVDLFSGCGGLSLGFEQAGFNVVAAYDNWQPAINVYNKNFSHPIYDFDLTNEDKAIQAISCHNPDLIMGGPPCQDFSSAGKRNISLGRANLTYHFANIVCSIKPEWFVMENVEQIKKSLILKDVVFQFIDKGYGLSSTILNASYCGVPQARTRLFIVGHLNDKHNQLNEIFISRLSNKSMTIRDYLGDVLGIDFYYRHPRNYNRRGIFSIDEPSPTVRGVNRPIPAGYKINQCDPKGVNLNEIRPLTTIERSYIQTFPKTFRFDGTKTNLEQMIGNAVPVNLAKYVAESINIYCKKGMKKELLLFDLDEVFEIPDKPLHRSVKKSLLRN